MKINQKLHFFGLIAVLSLMVGCPANSNAPTNTTPATNTNTSAETAKTEANKPAATAPDNSKPSKASASTDSIDSVYTDITSEKCKTTDSNEEEQWITQMCDGVGGYKLEVFEADIRQSINVIAPNGKKSELNFQANVSGAFSTLGEKAEWRVEKKDGKPVPFALIVRFNASNPNDETKSTSYLVVSKLTPEKSCITDVVKPSAKANEEARKLADASATKPCKAN